MPLCQEVLVMLEMWMCAHMIKGLQWEFVLNFCLCLWQRPPAAWCCTKALTPPTATVSCCHPLTMSSRPSSPRRWHPPLNNRDSRLKGDCHNQPVRCNSNCVCHHCHHCLPWEGKAAALSRPPASTASYKSLTQLPPWEKMSQAQDRNHRKMMLALLKSTAPKKTKQTQTPRASLEWPDVLLRLPKKESHQDRDPNAIWQQCQSVDGTFILLSLHQAGPVQTCQHQAKPCRKEQSWAAKDGTPSLKHLPPLL